MEKLANPARRRLFKGHYRADDTLRLPWVINEQVFIDGCTQCAQCIDVCESQILIKDDFGYPKIDFSQGQQECTFCEKCLTSCKEPLFKTSRNDSPWPVTLQISNKCLALSSIYCQSCADICQSGAITFGYHQSAIPEPQVDLDSCNQCGACLATCPQDAIKLTRI